MAQGNPMTPDYDPGPLSWVQGEIDEALARGLEALEAFVATPGDSTALKHARTHVHQAAGAIQMVGLDAVVAFTDEIERQLAALDDVPPQAVAAACPPIDRACRKLRIFLGELVDGAPPVPLKLFPEYEAMQRARGVRAVTPTDLFYPDLSAAAPRHDAGALDATAMPAFLVHQRRLFQRGLLAWLRGHADGAQQMRDVVAAIGRATPPGSLRAFWWSTTALADALVAKGLDSSFGVKQLVARIDLQIAGVAGPEAANNAGAQMSFIPLLTLGIPANSVMALMLGLMTIKGIIPGPKVIQEQSLLFWTVVASMWIGNLMLLVINLPLVGLWARLVLVPYKRLFPAILLVCCVGVFSVNLQPFDVLLMAGFALLGYILRKLDCEPAPLLLEFILAPLLEENLRRALLLSGGDPIILVSSKICLALFGATALLLVSVLLPGLRARREAAFAD